MPRLYVFADEAGCLEFSRGRNVSKYFIVCTISLQSCAIGHSLIELRRELAWRKMELGDYFHAAEDKQAVRDEVFKAICQHDFQIQALVMEKSKAQPQVRTSRARFYQYGWFFHFRHVAPKIVSPDSELMVTTASIGTKKERLSFSNAVDDVMKQTVRNKAGWATNFCPAAAEPCLQVADYCAWAIQRKWEKGDSRSYDLIKDRVIHEYDLWQRGTDHYY